jgi:outer membrane protein assembly factor BamB
MRGKLLWKKDLGVLNTGAYDLPEYEWGTASSPIIYKDLVIVQCDTQNESFVLAADIATGETVWKTVRRSCRRGGRRPCIRAGGGAELVTNASNFIRGYDPDTGANAGGWAAARRSPRRRRSSLATPSSSPAAARRSGRFRDPPGARGHHAARQAVVRSAVLWSKTGRGSYMPTPLIYQGILYVLATRAARRLRSASRREIYRQRIPHEGSGFSASRCAGGRIYLSSEDGDIFIVRAGRTFEILGRSAWASR